MKTIELTVTNKLGLHTRASSKLVSTASKFFSESRITKECGKWANCKSIMGLMILGAKIGDVLSLTVDGDDEKNALESIVELFNNKFNEKL